MLSAFFSGLALLLARAPRLLCSGLALGLLGAAVVAGAATRPGFSPVFLIGAGQSAAGLEAQGPAYSLPPDKLARAKALDRDRNILWGVSEAWSFGSLLLLLRLGWAARMRDRAKCSSSHAWLQGLLFLPMLLGLLTLLDLPLAIFGHHVSLKYGLSIERWGPWFWDWAKGLGVTVVAGTLVLSILFAVVRRAPERWWLWFWMISLPLMALAVYLVPLVIDPLFNEFEPLAKTNPALVAQLEQVVGKSGETIPPSRMFLMKASRKVTGLNAYVTGFGGSKRVVVWDTSLQKSTPDEVLFIFGHELGHYVLGDVLHGLLLSALGMLAALWLGFHAVRWMVRRCGGRWRIGAVEDWGSLVVLLLAFNVFEFISEPIGNAVSRRIEHRADVYGQEIIHGIVPNPQQTAQHSFQTLGEESLDVPDPNPFMVFWTYSHPPIAYRAAFARSYDPWAPGGKPRFFPKPAESPH